jgi:hypothetical protein
VKMVFSFKIFTFHEANTCVALPTSVTSIVSIMDQKVQLLKQLKLRELYTT